jgi:peptidoglycan/xylan/chitin deacetylase (PgdA/CDA1 family)
MKNKSKRFVEIIGLLFLIAGFLMVIISIDFISSHRTLPILMYHSISNSGEKSNILTINKDVFKQQMEYLRGHNYNVVSLKTASDIIKKGKKIPLRWVVLTFDDGNKDFYTEAYPIIKKYNFKVTIFPTIYRTDTGKEYMNWIELNNLMVDKLVDIGSHGLWHLPLSGTSLLEAKQQIFDSKLIFEKKLNKSVIFFSYPFGAVNDSIKKIVQAAGYEAAVGTAYRKGEFEDNDVYILKRVSVSNISKYPLIFRFMLSGYYIPTRELILRILNIKAPRDSDMLI